MATGAAADALSDRRLAAWGALCACAVLSVMAWPWWRGEIYLADDLAAFHLPLRQFYHDCLHAGRPFDWLPTLFAGFYLTGEGQLGGYHPLHWLLYRTLPLTTALGLELLLSYPVVLAGMWLWLRGRGFSRATACAGGLFVTFSSFQLLHLPHVNAVAIAAHMPWLLWFIDRLGSARSDGRPARWPMVGIATLTGSQILLGYPQYVWFSLVLEMAYLAAGSSWAGQRWRLPTVGGWLAAKATGAALGAVQLLPTVDALANSTRQAADASLPYYGSLHPLNLLQWIGPYLFTTRVVGQNTHELGCYLGAVPLTLLVWRLSHCGKRDFSAVDVSNRRLTRWGLGVTALALWLALGEYGGLYALQTWLPIVGKFRFPARYMALVCFGAALLAANALAQLQRDADHRNTRRSGGALLLLVSASFALATAAPWLFPAEFVAAWPFRLAGPALLLAASLLVIGALGGWRGALPALLLLAVVDQGAYGLSHTLVGKTARLTSVYCNLPAAPGDHADAVAMQLRSPDESISPDTNHLSLCGRRALDGYAGLEPARALDYAGLPALQAAGVRFVGRTSGTERMAGLLPFDNAWLTVPRPQPRVRFVTHVLVSPTPGEALAQIDVETTAVISRPLDIEAGPVGQAALAVDEPGALDVRVNCTTPQLLVVADSYHRGWQATADGQPRDVERVNGDFLGLVVQPGESVVQLRFAPVSLRCGKWISLTGLIGMIAGCLGSWLFELRVRLHTRQAIESRRAGAVTIGRAEK